MLPQPENGCSLPCQAASQDSCPVTMENWQPFAREVVYER